MNSMKLNRALEIPKKTPVLVYGKVHLPVWIEPQTKEKLRKIAAKENRSMGSIVREMIEEYVR